MRFSLSEHEAPHLFPVCFTSVFKDNLVFSNPQKSRSANPSNYHSTPHCTWKLSLKSEYTLVSILIHSTPSQNFLFFSFSFFFFSPSNLSIAPLNSCYILALFQSLVLELLCYVIFITNIPITVATLGIPLCCYASVSKEMCP